MVSVYQCFDPLKTCIVGRSFPPEFYSSIENNKVRSSLEKVAIETEEDYQKLIKKLHDFGVETIRLDVSEDVNDYKNHDGVLTSPPPMCPRDYSSQVGETFYMPSEKWGKHFDINNMYNSLSNNNYSKSKEQKYAESVMGKYLMDLMHPGRPVTLEQASQSLIKHGSSHEICNSPNNFLMGIDSEELDKVVFGAVTNTIGSNYKFPMNRRHYAWGGVRKWLEDNNVPIVYDQHINSACMWRLGKDLFFNYVNIINKINEKSFLKKWSKLFPNHRVHGVDIPGHGDGAMHPVKEGLIIATRDENFYKDFYPNWEIVTVESGWNKMKGFLQMKNKNRGRWWIKGEENNQDLIDYIDKWLDHWVIYAEESVFDVNVLPIDEQNCIVNGYNKKIFDAFDRHGVTPHVVNFRHRYFWDGGLHCITSDIHREGKMKTFW